MMFTYQKSNRYFAQIADGLEALGAEELVSLGAREVKPGYRGIYFQADQAVLYRVSYLSRLCTRVLAPLLTFACHSTKYLYRIASRMAWEEILTPDHTFAVVATVANSRITHSRYAALCLKDAIADRFREHTGKRPSVDTVSPDVWLNLHVEHNKATISLDASGGSLHRRGYRRETVKAPMQETLAAAIIRLTGWDGSAPLLDPMCGSGTLLAEALMHYCRIPAGFLRERFGFARLPDFEKATWQRVKAEADREIRDLPAGLVSGSDIDHVALAAARANLRLLPQGNKVRLRVGRLQDLEGAENSVLVANPPYGIRMSGGPGPDLLMKDIGDFLKKRGKGATAFLYLGDRELVKKIGLRVSWKKPLKNGGLDGILVKYDLW